MVSKVLQGISRDLDQPVNLDPSFALFKGSRCRCLIINEDQSATELWVAFADSYVFTVKKRDYFFVSKAVLKMKYPLIVYFYNNPLPLFLEYQKSNLSPVKLMAESDFLALKPEQRTLLANFVLDAQALHLAFNARVFKELYERKGLNFKVLLIIIGVVIVVILLILQLTGVVDVWGALSGAKKK